jgi:hypothetical protein
MIGFVFRNWSGARDLNPGPHGPESHDFPSRSIDFCGFQFDSSSRMRADRPDSQQSSARLLHELLHGPRAGETADVRPLGAGETQEHDNGATQPNHILVAEAADSSTQPGALNSRELVHHQAAVLAQRLSGVGSIGSLINGAAVGSVVNAQTVTESVASKR